MLARPQWQSIQDTSCPAFAMLLDLRRRGWHVVDAREGNRHDDMEEKTLVLRGVVRRKSYLRCLLTFETLQGQGMGSLSIGEHELYYKCMLLIGDKATVMPGMLVRDYRKALVDGGFSDKDLGNAPAIADGDLLPPVAELPAALAIEYGAFLDDGDFGQAEVEEEDVDGELANQGALGHGAHGVGHGGAIEDGVGANDPPAPPSSPSSDSSSSSDVVAAGNDGLRPFKRARDDNLPDTIEGVPVREEVYNESGDRGPQRYHRLIVKCPLSDSMHAGGAPCQKSRNMGPEQTRYFGKKEVIGYLGVWLMRASECASRADHTRYRPSAAEVEAYLVDRGMM